MHWLEYIAGERTVKEVEICSIVDIAPNRIVVCSDEGSHYYVQAFRYPKFAPVKVDLITDGLNYLCIDILSQVINSECELTFKDRQIVNEALVEEFGLDVF
jgi:hypothetical protein